MSHQLKKARNRKTTSRHAKSLNLYKFIRMILGADIADRQIAQRWRLNEKNFHEFKTGKYPVPRLSKLEELASILGVNKHLVFQVASGTSAYKVFNLLKRNDLTGQTRLLSNQLDEAHSALAKSEKRYRELFNKANDAILIADTKTGILLDCNKQAEQLLGRPKNEIVGMHQRQVHHPEKKRYYEGLFKKHVSNHRMNDLQKSEVIRKDGTIVPVYISTSVIEIDGKKLIQGIFRDVSGLKQ